jgi:hypothetical protein
MPIAYRWGAAVSGALGVLLFITPASPTEAAVLGGTILGGGGLRNNQATAIMPPASAHKVQSTQLFAVSCTSPGWCAAGGDYAVAGRPLEPMVVTQARGHWSPGVPLLLPANAAPLQNALVTGISCHTAGNCVAVGFYAYGRSNRPQGFIATESHGKWARAITPRLPANAASPASADLDAVTCTSDGSCEAVGWYQDSSGASQTMTLAKPAVGAWRQAVEVLSPSNAADNPIAFMTGIACTGPGSCVAVGNYSVSATQYAAMGAIESRGSWHRATDIAAPRGAFPAQYTAITSISCPAANSCFGVGEYAVSGTQSRAMTVTESKGRFGRAQQVTAVPPGRGRSPSTSLLSVSCAPASTCLAVGGGRNYLGQSVAMYMIRSGSHWQAAFLPPPSGAATGALQRSALFSVSCNGRAHCTAVGQYRNQSGDFHAEAAATVPAPPPVGNAFHPEGPLTRR